MYTDIFFYKTSPRGELLSIERTSAALRQSCVAFARLAEGHVDDVADEAGEGGPS